MKSLAKELSEYLKNDLIELSDYIYENPELGYEEVNSSKAHVVLLKKHGFEVEEAYMDMSTAFKAVYDSGKPGPTIAYMAEYDALPGIGHGCGHNILGATSTGAGIILSMMMKKVAIGGKVVVLGTPAEETSGAKVVMADKGAFSNIDIALVAHPADGHFKSGASLALEAIEFKYIGRASHAASSPEKGINALDAAINTFVSINALRQHVLPSARIHGIILEGGKAANVVPDLAVAQFYVRATTKTYLDELVDKVKKCAIGASMAAGTELEIKNYEASYSNLITNQALSDCYTNRLKELGVQAINEPRESYGSLDAGNVSQVVPTIHPYFDICLENTTGHTVAFAQATKTTYAYDAMMLTAQALALTGYDVINDESLLNRIREEFEQTQK